MFYTGVFINDETGSAGIVIIEKILKSARKVYHVSDIRQLPAKTSDKEIQNQVREIYKDSRFIRRKKVFSQNKRPPKITMAPPVLIVSHKINTPEKLAEFRNNSLTVEGILLNNAEQWHKEELTPLRYGSNYYVGLNDINDAIVSVLNAKRLTIDDNLNFSSELKAEFNKLFKKDPEKSDILNALSLPVWFCERIKQIKRY